jgi:hypothetical protein
LENHFEKQSNVCVATECGLTVGTVVGVAAFADGQKAAGGMAGGKQWLAAMYELPIAHAAAGKTPKLTQF